MFKNLLCALTLILLSIGAFAYLTEPVCVVTVTSSTRQERALLAPGALISLAFVNSIYDQREQDNFVLDRECRMVLRTLVFDGGGAADYGTDFTRPAGPTRAGARFIADGADRVYEQIILWADAVGQNELTLGERVLHLHAWERNGVRVWMRACPSSRATILGRSWIPDE